MKIIQILVACGLFLSANNFAASIEPHPKDSLLMIYLGKGTKLVLKSDLLIPANSAQLVFPAVFKSNYQDYCALEFTPSQEDRRLSAGRAIVLSGKQLKGYPLDELTVMSMEVQEPTAFKSISCRNTWDGKITVGELRQALSDKADLVFPEPSEITKD